MWENNTVEDEIQRNSLEYGVAVNTDRSIPDAKSGLKPVARRIIYDAFIENRTADKPHVKSARIVGDVMGRFHPHGDSSIYGAMIRLSQDWVMRYPLIDVHGNNGTILGDGPAASRYTEARLSKIAEEGLLSGLKKKNVDFTLNYDESEEEPITLPAIFPNLLCNPNEGIGWALGSSWAPHNLNEVRDAIIAYTKGEEPMLPGPDFPTGGVVINKDDIPNIIRTGHGTVKIRGKYTIEKDKIIFYEIPYGTRVETLMEEIGSLCDEGKLQGIIDVRNETGKKAGLKLVIQLEKSANSVNVIHDLFAKTALQSSFSYNQIALLGKTPVELNLKAAIKVYLDHNIDCLTRELTFDLNKATERKEIVDGLLKALADIDNIIKTIKASASAIAAKEALKATYQFSEAQAKAIVEMKLGRLAHLEKIELQNEYAELLKTIKELLALLNDDTAKIQNIIARLNNLVNRYGDARRTELIQLNTGTAEEQAIAEIIPEECVVVLTEANNIKRIPASTFKPQKRNGKGVKTQDEITHSVIHTSTIDALMAFTNLGKVYRINVNDIPSGTNSSKGAPVQSLAALEGREKCIALTSIERIAKENKYVWSVTKNGLIKKTILTEYANVKRKNGIVATNVREGDSLAKVFVEKDCQMIIFTKNGMCLRMNGAEIGASSRTATGVKAIALKEGDEVATVLPLIESNKYVILLMADGTAKKMPLTEFTLQNRSGKGLICSRSSIIVDALAVDDTDNILIVGGTTICISVAELPIGNRGSSGVKVLKDGGIITASKI